MDFEFINELLKGGVVYIDTIVAGNEFASGAIIAGLLGMMTYLCRAIPSRVFDALVKHTTTSLELNSTNKSYHLLATYLQKRGIADKSRYIKIGNGQYGCDTSIKELGYGTQILWFDWFTPMLVTTRVEAASASSNLKEFITLKKLGRSHKVFDILMKCIEEQSVDNTVTKFYEYSDGYERLIGTQIKRRMDTLALPRTVVDQLYKAIAKFVGKEQWYLDHQIPYQLGILLYGPSGTGKTSLIKAIAAYMNRDVCFVDTEQSLVKAAMGVKNSIIVVEEVDTLALEKREDSAEPPLQDGSSQLAKKTSAEEKFFRSFGRDALGRVLNALDGIFSNHGRIIIMTTNHVEILDPSLLRPGRIDLQIEVGYMCSETFNILLKRFFPDYVSRPIDVKNEVSPADVQGDVILGMAPEDLIEKYQNQPVNTEPNCRT